MSDNRRRVPRSDVVLADPRLVAARARVGAATVKAAVAAAQQQVRLGALAPEDVADVAVASLPQRATTLTPVLNATGVVLHTNLGRAPLSEAAREAVRAASGYVDVELDLGDGRRARRGRGALEALRDALDLGEGGRRAEHDVLVVNNGAAALVLVATALAAGREMVISRGDMVEIGDGFRLPDLLVSTGSHLREVGTTNRTAAQDYADGVSAETALLLKVHPSNFRMAGFTGAPSVRDLSALETGLPLVVDTGSGLLHPSRLLPDEPSVSAALDAGADLVVCSGDKLLGGPQAGLLVGRAELVERCRRHPLARALRVDKLTLAALEATLRGPRSPTSDALHADVDALRRRADAVVAALAEDGIEAEVVPSVGAVGGGGAPCRELPGWAVALPPAWASSLRTGDPAVLGRVERGRLLLDLRCVPEQDDDALCVAVLAASRTTPV